MLLRSLLRASRGRMAWVAAAPASPTLHRPLSSTAFTAFTASASAPASAPSSAPPSPPAGTVAFRAIKDCTKADMDLMTAMYVDACTSERLTQRALGLLRALDGEENMLGARVSLYEHCLQTATRAYHDGADEDTVVAALLHDVGELMSPSAHGDVAAAMLLPYIRYGV